MKHKKGRYFDVLLVLTAIIGFLTLFARYYVSQADKASASETAAVTIEISGLFEQSTDALSVGDTLILKSNGEALGYVSEITVKPELRRFSAPDGSVKYYESGDRYTVVCTAMCEGSFKDGGFFLDGKTHIAPNQTLSVSARKIECFAYVLSVDMQ